MNEGIGWAYDPEKQLKGKIHCQLQYLNPLASLSFHQYEYLLVYFALLITEALLIRFDNWYKVIPLR